MKYTYAVALKYCGRNEDALVQFEGLVALGLDYIAYSEHGEGMRWAKKGLTPSPSPRGEGSDMLCRCIAFWHKPRFYKFVFNLLLWTFRQHIAVLVPFSVFFFAFSYELFESTNTPYYFGISSKKCTFQSFLSSKKCSDWPFLSSKECEIVFLYATRTALF